MWNVPTAARLAKIPALGSTDGILAKDRKIYLHFFTALSDWYVAEFAHEDNDTFFGLVVMRNDVHGAVWGYFSFSELQKVRDRKLFQVDCEKETYFKPRVISQIDALKNLIV